MLGVEEDIGTGYKDPLFLLAAVRYILFLYPGFPDYVFSTRSGTVKQYGPHTWPEGTYEYLVRDITTCHVAVRLTSYMKLIKTLCKH